MGLETKTETIDGIAIETTQFEPLPGVSLGFRLVRALGPALVNLLPILDATSKDEALGMLMQFDMDTFGRALGQLNPQELDHLIRAVLTETRATTGGERVELNSDANINRVFAGKTRALLGAARFALKVNYANFFGDSSPKPVAPSSPTKAAEKGA